MGVQSLPSFLQHLRLVAAPDGADVSDGELLERYVARRSEEAFALLVRRHGPMVYGTCRRLLGNGPDAEDAFQAVFLVLARKARGIRRREAVAGWLYKVSRRVALEARHRRARRAAVAIEEDEPAPPSRSGDPPADAAWREVGRLLDEEVGRLPETYRVPFVLCYLEGRGHRAIAVELRCPLGTVEARLSRARERLRRGLLRRGVSLSSGLLAAVLAHGVASAGVPGPRLLAAAAAVASEGAGAVPAGIASLTEGVIRTMNGIRMKVALAMLLLVGVAGAAVALAYRAPADEKKPDRPRPARKADKPKDEPDRLQGTWELTAARFDGNDIPVERRGGWPKRLLISGDTIRTEGKYQAHTASLKLDAKKDPKTFDLTYTATPRWAGIYKRGIYKRDGDTLSLCWGGPEALPTKFSAESGEETILLTYKRTGDVKEPKTEAEKLKLARLLSGGNLTTLAVAMHTYHTEHGHFPRAAICDKSGKPLLSWRVALLPALGMDALYKEFKLDEPWDSDHNKKLLAKMPKVYAIEGIQKKDAYTTYYRVVTGKDTVFEEGKDVSITDITDGTVSTLLIVEAASAVPWTKPVDLPYDPDKALPKLGGLYKDEGINVATADGYVRYIKVLAAADEDTLRHAITRNDGEVCDLDSLAVP